MSTLLKINNILSKKCCLLFMSEHCIYSNAFHQTYFTIEVNIMNPNQTDAVLIGLLLRNILIWVKVERSDTVGRTLDWGLKGLLV